LNGLLLFYVDLINYSHQIDSDNIVFFFLFLI
jgi:hypothetical protein